MRLENKEEKQQRLKLESQQALEAPFYSWLNNQTYSPEEINLLKIGWLSAIHHLSALTPDAWMTDEEQPRLISNKTKNSSIIKSAMASFNIPLIKQP